MAPRVILISLDGATDAIVDRYLQSGTLDSKTGLGLLKSQGVAATDNETITPSLTAPSHVAIATGSTAVNNDINSNSFHLVANPFATNTSGFAAPIGGYSYQSGIDPAESTSPTANPLWLSLQNAGKKVVAATFPGADGASIKSSTGIVLDKKEDRTVSYTVPFGEFGGQGAKGISLTATDFEAAAQPTTNQLAEIGKASFSPILQTKVAIDSFTIGGVKFDFQVAALDTSNDNKTNYDSIVIFDAAQGIKATPTILPNTGSAFLQAGDIDSQPFYLEGSPNKVGTGFFLSNLATDLSTVRIARYSANNIPRPVDSPAVVTNVDDINNNVGFWKPQPDFRIPERLSPGFNNFTDSELEAIYQDQVISFVNYQTKVAVRAIQQNDSADLVMTYVEQPDGSEHQFLLTDPRQASDFTNPDSIGTGQDAGKVARYQKYVEFAYQEANNAVQKIIDTVGVDTNGRPNSNIIVVSDHGFAPFHTAVSMNNLLKNAGFDSNKVRAITSGPAVNIYINLKGREPNGIVEVSEYSTLQKQVLETLQGFLDVNPNYVTGDPSSAIFDKIYNREVPANAATANDIINARGAFIGEDTGDVFALLKTGYNFDGTQAAPVIRKGDAASTSPVLSVPNFYGAHGYDPTLPEMKAIYYAAGPDIGQQQLGSVRNIDVAPTIEKILGVTPAATVDGTAISQNLPAFSGIAAGDATANSVILWTRTFDSLTQNGISTKLNVQVSTDSNFTNVPFNFETSTDAARDYTTKVNATGLKSGTQYYYRFQSPTGQTSAMGKFSTAAASGTQSGLRFGVTGDWRGEIAPYPAVANADDRNLKFFVELGDTIYADYASPALKNPDGTEKDQATTLADYQVKQNEVYSQRFGQNYLGDLRAATSIMATVDDHEVVNDFQGGLNLASASSTTQSLYGATSGLVNDSPLYENGLQAFQDYNPIADRFYGETGDNLTAGERQLYRATTYGSDALNVVLDARSFRDPGLKEVTNLSDQAQVSNFLAQSFNPDRTLLGRVQVDDLKRDLLQAQKDGVTWKFINLPEPIQNIGVFGAGDRYEGYAAERTEILKFINDNNINNVVFVSADIHGTLVNNLTYQLAPGQAQIATNAFEISTGAVAFDAPFGLTVAQLAAAAGILTPAQQDFYNSLPVANDTDSVANDKDDFIKSIVDGGLVPLGYDPLGLNNNLTQANGLIKAKLLQGDYVATQTFGWTEFDVDQQTQKLTVTTYGIDPYTRAELEANPSLITGRQPQIVSQFEVEANPVVADAKLVSVGVTDGDDNLIALNGTDFDGRSNVISTGAGNDSVDLSFSIAFAVGNNRIDLGSGDDTVFVSQGDRVFGCDGDDVFEATDGKGNNRMSGGAGNDTFYLGSGDRALGGDGNDRFFVGNGGDNLLTGGAGVDQFWLANAELPAAPNTILDFQVGTDVIGIQGSASLGINATSLILSQVGDDTSIGFGGQTLAILKSIQASSLTPSNSSQFVFA